MSDGIVKDQAVKELDELIDELVFTQQMVQDDNLSEAIEQLESQSGVVQSILESLKEIHHE